MQYAQYPNPKFALFCGGSTKDRNFTDEMAIDSICTRLRPVYRVFQQPATGPLVWLTDLGSSAVSPILPRQMGF